LGQKYFSDPKTLTTFCFIFLSSLSFFLFSLIFSLSFPDQLDEFSELLVSCGFVLFFFGNIESLEE